MTDTTNTKKSYKEQALRLEYILKRRELELDAVRGELKGEREVNSLCAAFIMYLISRISTKSSEGLYAEINKNEVKKLVGSYYADVKDGGDNYVVTLNERTDRSNECGK